MPSRMVGSLEDYARDVKRFVKIELKVELREIGEFWIRHFKQVTQDWENKPQFEYTLNTKSDLWLLTVFTDQQIFEWVDKGTDGPYIIRPRRATYLKFRGGYNAKTQPVAQFGVGSGGANGPWVSTQIVIHPGIKPREFMKVAERDLKERFDRRIQQAIDRGIRRAG